MNGSNIQVSNLKNQQLELELGSIQVESVATLPSAKKGTASSLGIHYKNFGEITFTDCEVFSKVPAHPFWGQVEKFVDFSFADELCASLYSPLGQRPFSPSLKLKVHLVQAYENLSDREMELRLMYDIGIKRFIGVPLSFIGLDHSTLGLDRDRMGSELFHACFHYILAQALQHKLWGNNGMRWLMDSFHTYANAVKMSAYRLVLHGTLNIIQQLKRANRPLFNQLERTLHISTWFQKLPSSSTPEERVADFSQLVARAYALLTWFESDRIRTLFWTWEDSKTQLRSLELQAILYKILLQNTREKLAGSVGQEVTKEETSQDRTVVADTTYEKIPKKERPADRIENAHDPSVRSGNKSPTKRFTGDKCQVVQEDGSLVIIEIEPIPGNEHDGQALEKMMETIIETHGIVPPELTGDSHYGSISNRLAMQEKHIELRAPVPKVTNPKGLLSMNEFTYDEESCSVMCPAGNVTTKRYREEKFGGFRFSFKLDVCKRCPLLEGCTTNKKGRTIFISDHYKMMQEAEEYNVSEVGKAVLQDRYKIERTNNELANHHGLRNPRTRSREKMRITTKLKGMAVNVKLMVKKLGTAVRDPFVRYPRKKKIALLCP
jgi:hypothetical protein